MPKLRKIDLEPFVPTIARTVKLRYKFDSQFGGVFLHRSGSDVSPVELSPPGGKVELELIEPQTVYVQELDGSDGFTISVLGYAL